MGAGGAGTRRLGHLVLAGGLDSFCLSMAWAVLMLRVVAEHGLGAAGLCSAAALVGVAASAPVTSRLAVLLDGRRLLRTTALTEAALRAGVFVLAFLGAPVWMLAAGVTAMNVMAWTGYAGMRAEVNALGRGAAALTWYATLVASVEAGGIATAALLPVGPGVGLDAVLAAVLAAYVLSLVPTMIVANGSPIPPAAPRQPAPRSRRLRPAATPTTTGAALMLLASAPTLMSVALAAEYFGRAAVAPSAIAFTVGSLVAPACTGLIPRRRAGDPLVWMLCAVGIVAGWVVAPLHLAFLCLAQLLSGVCMTTLEGLLDVAAADGRPGRVTGAIATATSGRALGSAAGTALFPLLVASTGLGGAAQLCTGIVLAAVGLTVLLRLRRRAGAARLPLPDPVA